MIEILRNTELANKIGGKFKLTALIQKRLGELVRGSRPLIEDSQGKAFLEIVVQEIVEGKIAPDMKSKSPDNPQES